MPSWQARTRAPAERLVVPQTTALLVPQAAALLDLPGLGRLGHFLAVSASHPAWISFYVSAAARDVDRDRPFTKDPDPGAGVLLDLAITDPAQPVPAPPGGTYYSAESGPQPPLRARVRHRGSAPAAITVTVSAIVLVP